MFCMLIAVLPPSVGLGGLVRTLQEGFTCIGIDQPPFVKGELNIQVLVKGVSLRFQLTRMPRNINELIFKMLLCEIRGILLSNW